MTMDIIPYISGDRASNELKQLQNHPTIRDFAAVKPETYEIIKASNPTLRMMIDVAKKIMEVEA